MLRVSSKIVLLKPNMLTDALIDIMGSVTPGYKKKKLIAVSINPKRGNQLACFHVAMASCHGFKIALSI
jgi:hypothetical protein